MELRPYEEMSALAFMQKIARTTCKDMDKEEQHLFLKHAGMFCGALARHCEDVLAGKEPFPAD